MTVYTVEKGDTLGKIAYKYFGGYEKWKTLAEYNDLIRPDLIQVGDVIKLPPWEPRVFRWPLWIKKSYYNFGDLYRSGPWRDRPHPGVDLHEYDGAPVFPIGEGMVIRNRFDPSGYGWYVLIEHRLADGRPLFSLYAHLAFASIYQEGVIIGRGREPINWEGSTGAAGVPHLHLETKRTDEMGLYSKLTLRNLIDWYYDPSLVIRNVEYLCLPVQCWGCKRCN